LLAQRSAERQALDPRLRRSPVTSHGASKKCHPPGSDAEALAARPVIHASVTREFFESLRSRQPRRAFLARGLRTSPVTRRARRGAPAPKQGVAGGVSKVGSAEEGTMPDDLGRQGRKDELKGTAKELEGKVRKTAGKLTDDPGQEIEGNVQELGGKIRKELGRVERDLDRDDE
jgi:uncharacterized protein YjbJ (UPF0337 family)